MQKKCKQHMQMNDTISRCHSFLVKFPYVLLQIKEAKRLKEFLEDYDDERDDPKYYRYKFTVGFLRLR